MSRQSISTTPTLGADAPAHDTFRGERIVTGLADRGIVAQLVDREQPRPIASSP